MDGPSPAAKLSVAALPIRNIPEPAENSDDMINWLPSTLHKFKESIPEKWQFVTIFWGSGGMDPLDIVY